MEQSQKGYLAIVQSKASHSRGEKRQPKLHEYCPVCHKGKGNIQRRLASLVLLGTKHPWLTQSHKLPHNLLSMEQRSKVCFFLKSGGPQECGRRLRWWPPRWDQSPAPLFTWVKITFQSKACDLHLTFHPPSDTNFNVFPREKLPAQQTKD